MVVRPFSREIVETLSKHDLGEPIHFVGLGAHDFQFAYGDFVIRSENEMTLNIAGQQYEWLEEPLDAPVWKLIGQEVASVAATSDMALKFGLRTGDAIELRTDEGPYEAVIIEAANRGIMEVF